MSRKSIPFCGALLAMLCLASCAKTAPAPVKTTKTANGETPKSPPVDFAKMLPEKTLLYVRISDVQKVKNEFINPKHVKDAKTAKKAWTALMNETLSGASKPGNSLGVSAMTLLQLTVQVKTVQVGVFPSQDSPSQSEYAGFVELSESDGLDALLKQLAPQLKAVTVAGKSIQVIDGPQQAAFHRESPTSILIGTQSSLRAIFEMSSKPKYRSLADSSRFQQAVSDFGASGELMTYADLELLRTVGLTFPLTSVSHVAGSVGVDGGFGLRAYAADGESLPTWLVRTPREKKLLSRLPKSTAAVLAASFDADVAQRQQFAKWVTQLVTSDNVLSTSVVPQGVRELAKSFLAKPAGVENDAAAVLRDLWLGLGAVKTESAIFVAPNSQEQWGAAAVFDSKDQASIAAFKKRLRELGKRANVEWKAETVDGLEVHSINLSTIIAGHASQPVPEMVERLLQTDIGYAEAEGLFAIGSVDLIKFVLQTNDQTLAGEFSYEHLDENNAMIFSIRPGRILHRKFGLVPVDRVLRKVAGQIPIDSNYALTVNLQKPHVTLRSNIPFTSLVGWLVLEWLGKGPANLKEEMPDAKKPAKAK